MQDQNHPLYAIDRDHVDRLLAKESPEEGDLVELARLLVRYEDFPGAPDLQTDMEKIMRLWGMTRDSLNDRARAIWNKGYRPGKNVDESVGSSFDTADNSNN